MNIELAQNIIDQIAYVLKPGTGDWIFVDESNKFEGTPEVQVLPVTGDKATLLLEFTDSSGDEDVPFYYELTVRKLTELQAIATRILHILEHPTAAITPKDTADLRNAVTTEGKRQMAWPVGSLLLTCNDILTKLEGKTPVSAFDMDDLREALTKDKQ